MTPVATRMTSDRVSLTEISVRMTSVMLYLTGQPQPDRGHPEHDRSQVEADRGSPSMPISVILARNQISSARRRYVFSFLTTRRARPALSPSSTTRMSAVNCALRPRKRRPHEVLSAEPRQTTSTS